MGWPRTATPTSGLPTHREKTAGASRFFKFSPEGKILMTLGKAGVAGAGPDTFNGPAGVAVAPNGDIFVADGPWRRYECARREIPQRMERSSTTWGKKGSGPGEFDHSAQHCAGFEGTRVRRRPCKQPDSNLRSGRKVHRSVEAVRPSRAESSFRKTTRFMRWTRNRMTRPIPG